MVEHDAHLGQVGDRPLPDRGQHLAPPRQCRTAILAQRPDGIEIRHGDFLAIDAYRAGLRIVDEIVFTRLADAQHRQPGCARPGVQTNQQRWLVSFGQRVDDAFFPRLAGEQRPRHRVGFLGHHDHMLTVFNGGQDVCCRRFRLAGAFDHHIEGHAHGKQRIAKHQKKPGLIRFHPRRIAFAHGNPVFRNAERTVSRHALVHIPSAQHANTQPVAPRGVIKKRVVKTGHTDDRQRHRFSGCSIKQEFVIHQRLPARQAAPAETAWRSTVNTNPSATICHLPAL